MAMTALEVRVPPYEFVRDELLLRMRVGQRIELQPLADRADISVSLLREILLQLFGERLVWRSPAKGGHVRWWPAEDELQMLFKRKREHIRELRDRVSVGSKANGNRPQTIFGSFGVSPSDDELFELTKELAPDAWVDDVRQLNNRLFAYVRYEDENNPGTASTREEARNLIVAEEYDRALRVLDQETQRRLRALPKAVQKWVAHLHSAGPPRL
jgi:hypothetical protein